MKAWSAGFNPSKLIYALLYAAANRLSVSLHGTGFTSRETADNSEEERQFIPEFDQGL
jgi:hypothetical protein